MDQPFTTPLGSNEPPAHASKKPSVSSLNRWQRAKTWRSSGEHSSSSELAPVEAADLAVRFKSAEGVVHPVQPFHGRAQGRLDVPGGRRSNNVERHHRPHYRFLMYERQYRRYSPSFPRLRKRGLKRLGEGVAGEGSPGNDVDVHALSGHRFLLEDGHGVGIDHLRAAVDGVVLRHRHVQDPATSQGGVHHDVPVHVLDVLAVVGPLGRGGCRRGRGRRRQLVAGPGSGSVAGPVVVGPVVAGSGTVLDTGADWPPLTCTRCPL